MKIILLILIFSAVALCAPAKDGKNSVKHHRRNSEYNANLKFDWTGENSWKAKIEAMFKPIVEALNALGFKGDLLKDHNGKNNGHIIGNFHFSGHRGNGSSNIANTKDTESVPSSGPSVNDISYPKLDLPSPSVVSDVIQNPSSALKIGKNYLPKNLPSAGFIPM